MRELWVSDSSSPKLLEEIAPPGEFVSWVPVNVPLQEPNELVLPSVQVSWGFGGMSPKELEKFSPPEA
jgi:hypothetical protein